MSKRHIILTVFLLLLSLSGRSQSPKNKARLDDYYLQNDKEIRLIDYKDSREDLKLKIEQLELINSSRKKHRAAPVELDILASRVANKICKEAALNNYMGHWNLAGEKPYHRHAFAGGVDHVSENASAEMTTGIFSNSLDAIAERMKSDHEAFMSERKPNDGHKQTVIDKNHNYLGLGIYTTDQQFRYYELYIDRYYEFEDVPSEVKPGERFVLKCRPQAGHYFILVIAYYEKEPKPLSPKQISSRPYYNDYTDDIAYQIAPWEIDNYLTNGSYNIPLQFDKKGLYYVHIYSDDKPYKEGSRFKTEGKLQASGIVIRVN
jgi:uncharacterized protein YkwD